MDFFGLDIGVSSARLVQLEKDKGELNMVQIGSTTFPYPGIRSDSGSQLNDVVVSIKKLFENVDISTRKAVISIPEEKVVTRIKWFPKMKEKEVDSALKYEAETFIPHPLEKVEIDYQVVRKEEDGRLLVFIVGVLKSEIKKYKQLAEMTKINLIALEPQSISLNRILAVENIPVIIANINYDYTGLAVSQGGELILTRTISIGTSSFSRAVKVNLGLKGNEAEAYRETYGLKSEELEGRVRQAMMPIVEKLVRDIKQTTLSFQKEHKKDVELIILSGKGARTPNLAEVITKNLGIEVQIAEPFSQIQVPENINKEVKIAEPDYSVACGLAARGLK